MLDIIYSLFQTIIHGITTLLNMILAIPTYIAYVIGFFNFIPGFLAVPLTIALLASIIIAIKRLVL